MPTKSEHRAAIRGVVIAAALDLNEFRWSEADDRLLDIIDKWLDVGNQSTAATLPRASVHDFQPGFTSPKTQAGE